MLFKLFKKIKNNAFTFTETLLAIALIGTVAFLTIPDLANSVNKQRKIAKIQKIYSTLNKAQTAAIQKHGALDSWFNTKDTTPEIIKNYTDKLTQFLTVNRNCGTSTGCFSYQEIADGANSDGHNYVILPNNVAIAIIDMLNKPVALNGYEKYYGKIALSLNASDKSVEAGQDLFYFAILESGIEPLYSNSALTSESDLKKYVFQNRIAASTWILKNQNMDYLDANEKGECKTSTKKLSWSETSCR